jgi:AcrR family transcriptional regulator
MSPDYEVEAVVDHFQILDLSPETPGRLSWRRPAPYGTVLTNHGRLAYTIRYRMGRKLSERNVIETGVIDKKLSGRKASGNNLGRSNWLCAARLALLRGGVEAVRVEKLARDLGVTKGSFYWHFKDRDELLELLLREWESEVPKMLLQVGRRSGREKVQRLVRLLEQRAKLSEEGKEPSDAAIFAWASVDREVARRVNRAEEERIQLLKHFVGDRDRMEFFYLVWLGFVARGQRVPESRKRFPAIARFLVESLSEPKARLRMHQRSRVLRRNPAKRVQD